MKKKPMTTAEVFNAVSGILKEEGKLPDILDYSMENRNPVPIKSYEFELISCLDYGASEGIYLDLWLEFEGVKPRKLGTYKTLEDSEKAMHIMAGLLADFTLCLRSYVKQHLDDFTWEGIDVYGLDEEGTKHGCMSTCGTWESAVEQKDKLLLKYSQVVIRDNATRKEEIFKRH